MASVKFCLFVIFTISLLKSDVNHVMVSAMHFKVHYCESDTNWFLWENDCYRAISDSLNWRSAQMFCRNINAELTSIHKSEESKFIMALVKDHSNIKTTKIWIGLHALITYRMFEWSDESAVNYRNWNKGEPNNDRQGEDCGQMIVETGLWNDEPCSHQMGFVCKKRKATETKTTIASSPSRKSRGKKEHHHSGRLGTGAIVGIALGCLALGIILITACVYLRPWVTSNILFHPIK